MFEQLIPPLTPLLPPPHSIFVLQPASEVVNKNSKPVANELVSEARPYHDDVVPEPSLGLANLGATRSAWFQGEGDLFKRGIKTALALPPQRATWQRKIRIGVIKRGIHKLLLDGVRKKAGLNKPCLALSSE